MTYLPYLNGCSVFGKGLPRLVPRILRIVVPHVYDVVIASTGQEPPTLRPLKAAHVQLVSTRAVHVVVSGPWIVVVDVSWSSPWTQQSGPRVPGQTADSALVGLHATHTLTRSHVPQLTHAHTYIHNDTCTHIYTMTHAHTYIHINTCTHTSTHLETTSVWRRHLQ